MTEYHQAPHTLDPSKELPDEIAPSAGHSEDQSERVRELHDEFKAGVEEAAASASERADAGTSEPPYAVGAFSGEADEEADPKA
jgi:hypothetical protein